MERVLVFDHDDRFVFELSEQDVRSAVRTERVNGEHKLVIATHLNLEREWRIITRTKVSNGTLRHREYVVTGISQLHDEKWRPYCEYTCVWSLQHDLEVAVVSTVATNKTSAQALDIALSGTNRWFVAYVSSAITGRKSLSFWHSTAWESLSAIVEAWGCEVDSDVIVDTKTMRVTTRRLWLDKRLGELGDGTPVRQVRRFEYGYELSDISREVSDEPVGCRLIPLGKGEETSGGGYGRKLTIKSVNDGKDYLVDQDMVYAIFYHDADGNAEYPTLYAENPDIEDAAELKAWGESVLYEYTRPKVTYSGTVSAFAAGGLEPGDIEIGDHVLCIDHGFPGGGLRFTSRVTEISEDLKDSNRMSVTIGQARRGIIPEVIRSLLPKVKNLWSRP